jgi:hypothetical protein
MFGMARQAHPGDLQWFGVVLVMRLNLQASTMNTRSLDQSFVAHGIANDDVSGTPLGVFLPASTDIKHPHIWW